MNVTHVVLSMDVGGSERNVINQVREGRKLGQDVSIVCLERLGVLAPQAQALGARMLCLNKAPGLRPALFHRLRAVLRQIRSQIVHTHQVGTLFYSRLATLGLPDVHLVHTAHGREAYGDRLQARWLGRVGSFGLDRFFCLTQDIADELIDHRITAAHKIHLITNGIDTTRFQNCRGGAAVRAALSIPGDSIVLGSVGRLVDVKNYELLIRSFAAVKHQVSRAHLLLVGDGPLNGPLRDLADELNVSESVHFAGYQSEIWTFLDAMDLFILTSKSEGTPQAVLEASVAGLPIIASNVGGLAQVIEDGRTGLLFPSHDCDALTSAIMRLIGDLPLRVALARAGKARVTSVYDVARMARDYHRHYLQLLNVCR
jgi:glycosyltransferase involved in cell wall biosynthesis